MAITALARKLVTIAYLMLKNNEPYRYARPELMRKKFAKLEVIPKRSKASSLDSIYRAAGLPQVKTPDQLPDGEDRMLTELELQEFVRELYQPPTKTPRTRAKQNVPADAGRPSGRPK